MISWNDFEDTVCTILGRDISTTGNPSQNRIIRSSMNQSTFVCAGPGSGKTSAISLRVLKLIFVDDVDPSSILVTTFTKKAAAELRSRILGWGDQLKGAFIGNASYNHVGGQLQSLNINRIVTGTLDSIAEEVLGEYRAPGAPSPVVIEDFVSNAVMVGIGLFSQGRHNSQSLRRYITNLRGTAWGLNVAELSATLRDMKDRFFHDQVDVSQYRSGSGQRGAQRACEAIDDYLQELRDRLLFDFTRLESDFLEHLQTGTLNEFLQGIRFVLVDEYQDTNLLQEQIYFQIARAAIENSGGITVVGDDDQSLYRFRGATVDIFQVFQQRINRQVGLTPNIEYLSNNYRSTQAIVDFCNAFISLDRQYQTSRVPGKPPIAPARSQPFVNYPPLGMFRDDVNTLATDLANFIHVVVHGNGFQIQNQQGNRLVVRIHRQGSPSDIAILLSSPREFSRTGTPRLPFLLRQELDQLNPPIPIFNPRGQSLPDITEVQILCGLLLECIDPISRVQNSIPNLPQDAQNAFRSWRTEAMRFLATNPNPTRPRSLVQFVTAWQNRSPLGARRWKREIPLVDLIYKLVTWIPNLQNDIEGLVYLEAITRAINQSALFSDFQSEIIFDPSNTRLEQSSIKEALWKVFVPIASGAIEVNEELLETLPNDRINVFSVHQTKGLEFPLVIVDVGSDFRRSHPRQAFRRFPTEGGEPCNMEDALRAYSPLGQPRASGLDRAFDDLIRLHFVAYSRAQDVLLLVGLNSVRYSIQNIGTGWDRDGNWRWGRGLPNLFHI